LAIISLTGLLLLRKSKQQAKLFQQRELP